jgi:hypothetical protein
MNALDLEAIAERQYGHIDPLKAYELLKRLTEDHKDATQDDSTWLQARVLWEVVFRNRENDYETILEISKWLRDNRVPLERALRLSNRLAWITQGESTTPDDVQWQTLLTGDAPALHPSDLFVICLYAYRRRFLFQFRAIERLFASMPAEFASYRSIPWAQALLAYSTLGRKQYDPAATRSAKRMIIAARDGSKGKPGERDVLDIALHALDAAQNPAGDGLPELVIEISQDEGPIQRQPVLLFRLAKAHSRMGSRTDNSLDEANHHRDLALKRFNEALDSLTGDRDFTRFLGEQIRQEREVLIRSHLLATQWLQSREEMLALERRVRLEAQASTIRSTEVLALFSSAVAFAVGAAAIGSNAETALAAVATGFALLLGLLGFATALIYASRLTVARIAPTRPQNETWAATTGAQLDRLDGATILDNLHQLIGITSRWRWLSIVSILVAIGALTLTVMIPFLSAN